MLPSALSSLSGIRRSGDMRQRDSIGALLRLLGEVVGEVWVVFLQVT